jgi:hypothetical protein
LAQVERLSQTQLAKIKRYFLESFPHLDRLNRMDAMLELTPFSRYSDMMQKFTRFFLLPLAAAIALTGCASGPSMVYRDYEGGDAISGKGGTRRTVDGMAIWDNGAPPRKFKVIGIITDQYPEFDSEIRNSEKKAVAMARERGGDALILVAAQSRLTHTMTDIIGGPGFYSGGWGYGRRFCGPGPVYGFGVSSAMTIPQYNRLVKYQVIQYVK